MSRLLTPDDTNKLWLVLALGSVALLAYLSYRLVGTVLLAMFLYYSTRPFYYRLRRVMWPSLAAALSLIAVVGPLLALVAYTGVIAYEELTFAIKTHDIVLLKDSIAPLLDNAQLERLSYILQSPYEAFQDGLTPELAGRLFEVARRSASIIANGLLHLLLVFALVYYFLKEGSNIRFWANRELQYRESIAEEFMMKVDNDFHYVFFGNFLNAVIAGLIAVLIFNVLNLVAPESYMIQYPALLGILCGFASLIPIVGVKLIYVPYVSFILARIWVTGQYDILWFPISIVVLISVLADFIPDVILRPYITGRSVHMGALLIAYTVGPLLFGWYGFLFGPVIVVLLIRFIQIVVPTLVDRDHTTL